MTRQTDTEENALPVTVLLAAKNEAINLPRCLAALRRAARVIVLDSQSTDATADIAVGLGAEVVQFCYAGGYPKKRQWAMENLDISTPWVLLIDADEVVPDALWDEIGAALSRPDCSDAFLITKGFHFLGRRFRYGGFSHSAVLLFRNGCARFERLFDDNSDSLDMEIHERVVVDGRLGGLRTPLIHEDFKGLEAYIARHNKYSTWEARVRHWYFTKGRYGEDIIQARLFGNSQERRRALKEVIICVPFEHWVWFCYHYFFRLGVFEGRAGLIASQIRASYIAQVNAKLHEMRLEAKRKAGVIG
ncbi:glycosyltransferase family 2 protein [Methylotetracoccus oryzae]|uniref:glycosyltransferase family 2 protein n=1 Tax=Methylotetracoccus oryzae TaxID=1919059 RepID=UPI001119C936|nr:glycosyltransferase family 2 protein [Methylotetracoccus oryzae]